MAANRDGNQWNNDFEGFGREAYRKQNDLVRQAASGRKFLEYETGSGWGPLCDFLGLPVPDIEYPRADDWVSYKKNVEAKENTREGVRMAVE